MSIKWRTVYEATRNAHGSDVDTGEWKKKETGEHGNEDYYGKARTRFTVLHRFGKWPFTSREEKRRIRDPV
jgi:hypothetical protein